MHKVIPYKKIAPYLRTMGTAMTSRADSHLVWTRRRLTVFPLLLALLPLSSAFADHSTPLFSDDSIIKVSIRAPFSDIMRQRSEDFEPEGTFEYKDDSGEKKTFDIKVRSRGHFRARPDVCDFTPLRLNFKKKQVAGTEFEGQDKLKLVTHCELDGRHQEQLVLREYLAYRFYATLTDDAFRVRLLEVTYRDSNRRMKRKTRYAFLLETKDQVAKRTHIRFANVSSLKFDQLDQERTNLVTVFSYFIGNTDFSAIRGPKDEHCCHNVMLLTNKTGYFVPVPFDFDFSGIVDAPYAAPNPRFELSSVRERLYRGLCRNNELLPATLALFNENRGEIQALVDNLDALGGQTRKKLNNYIADFYKTIEEESMVEQEFLTECSSATEPPVPT